VLVGWVEMSLNTDKDGSNGSRLDSIEERNDEYGN